MPIWLAPALTFLSKGWERFISIVIYLILAAALLFACYATFIKPTTHPNPTTTQTGGVSYNYNVKVGLGGCASIPVVKDKK